MRQKIGKYLELTKPKVTLLNLLVGVTCFVLAVFPSVDWVKLAVFSGVGYLAAGGCGVLNSVYDQDIDKLMPRTSKRAIPSGQVPANEGLMLGGAMISLSLAVSFIFFNLLTALMFALGAAFYLVIYTVWLKRASPWNVVIGGFAGCFAGLSGWAASANVLSAMPLLVALLDFLWTPGHLWGLAIKKVKEFKQAGIPMLPVKIGIASASRVVFCLNVLTVASSLMFPLLHLSGIVFSSVALASGAAFLFKIAGYSLEDPRLMDSKCSLHPCPSVTILMFGLILDKIFLI